jgi:hypothetical protein
MVTSGVEDQHWFQGGSWSGSRDWMTEQCKILQKKNIFPPNLHYTVFLTRPQMKDVQNTAEGVKSALQNIKFLVFFYFFVGHFCPHGSASGSKKLVTSSLGVRSSANTVPVFIYKNIYHSLQVKLPRTRWTMRNTVKRLKITFEIFFKVFTFHKSPLGTKSVQKLHDDVVQWLARNCLCLLCTEYTVKCTVYLLCTLGCRQATEYI